jgi:tripartite ATP-independent transporter DctP family solute receptor
MKRLLGIVLVFAVVISFCGAGLAAEYEIKIAYENHPGEPTDLGVHEWARLTEEISGGKIKVELYPSSQLGAKKDVMEMILMGSNVVTIADAGFLMDYVPDVGIMYAPYLTDTYEEYFALVDSPWFAKKMEEVAGHGFEVVTAKWIYGDRHLLANKPVKNPSDLKGLKIRTPNMEILMKTIEYMGGIPTPMPLSECYPAIAQGVIDGAENPYPVLWGAKLYEKARYLTPTAHVKNVSIWLGSHKFFESLPADISSAFKEAAEKACLFVNENVKKDDAQAIEDFKKAGVTVVDADIEAFKTAVMPIYEELWSKGLYEEVKGQLQPK